MGSHGKLPFGASGHDTGSGYLVSAWACRQRLVLAQEAVAEKANEIVAIPLLLKHLELRGRRALWRPGQRYALRWAG